MREAMETALHALSLEFHTSQNSNKLELNKYLQTCEGSKTLASTLPVLSAKGWAPEFTRNKEARLPRQLALNPAGDSVPWLLGLWMTWVPPQSHHHLSLLLCGWHSVANI